MNPLPSLAAPPLDAAAVREIALAAGADDVGFVSIDRAEVADQRQDLLAALPGTRTLIAFVCRMNRGPIRSSARSAANLEFHHVGDRVNEVGRRIVRELEARGQRALNPSMGFPMEADKWPGKMWIVSHKPVAVAAGLGQMGIHRNVIHPRFGSFVLLGTILTDWEEAGEGSGPIDFNPCLECKLCVAACPVGAIGADGHFDFSSCYTHNYREFMGGFSDFVESVVDSRGRRAFREKVRDAETVSMWQSLSFGANYKAAYCLGVCPAGEDVIGPYEASRKDFLDDIVRPLQKKEETVYVLAGSDAEKHVQRRFPHKEARRVGNGLRPRDIPGFLQGMPLTFQRGQAKGLDLTIAFRFTGRESEEALVVIRDQELEVRRDVSGEKAELEITVDSDTWLGILAEEKSPVWALLTRRLRVRGRLADLKAFQRCFP